jgi:peptidyl-tRNA hydrolase
MQNIIDLLGTDRIKRIRIGIGEPPFSGVDWVLTKPKGEEKEKVESAAGEAAKAIRDYLLNSWDYAMNHYNQKEGRIERTA